MSGEDPLANVTRAADDLYQLRDTYFPQNPDDKIAKLQAHSDLALNLLDSIPPEERKLPMQRAMYEYLRGKILDVFSDYRKEAEDHLSKAVKLNPSLADAWLCLGNCIWKKGDLSAAKNCFTLALSKVIVCTENQTELVEESIQHAKAAIALDVKDGNSWYNLGNACLTSFFVTGAWDHSKLRQSLKAYQNAEKDERMESNPDLYFNCATVNKYLENYERALTGFEAAAVKDPGLKATEEVQKIVYLLDKIDNLLIKEGDQLTLLEPFYRHVDFSWKGKIYQFNSIRVDFIEQVLVNGMALSPQQAVHSSIFAQHQP
ncbi:N-terminal acetyltransferase A, auxiliary subunit [Parasponia andersonii]|uniref:N-terminal acetyltransferase A, auxiliary subunit n=1 Tax=Parasponia andersonii TaxID=3476 RepID=A0A2P5D556_PARAD|nr:N-terminal acetyltransferase A, auxiliary subunit [Parasponia andersonii]